jgi:hypothetical protein
MPPLAFGLSLFSLGLLIQMTGADDVKFSTFRIQVIDIEVGPDIKAVVVNGKIHGAGSILGTTDNSVKIPQGHTSMAAPV